MIPIGGFDLLITYDVSAFTVLSASIGPAVSGWEYFTYRLGPFDGCGTGCPSGLVRLVAIADINNGANHPPADQFEPDGVVASVAFQVTTNTTFAGLVYPVKFYWWDCGDNAVSTITGDTLLVDMEIYEPEFLLWDEDDDAEFPEASRPKGVGAPDSCLVGDKNEPLRCITFRNGSICIIHNDSIDARGDINLNGLAHEIGDAVLFTNYFLKGIGVFNISVAGQTAASDVNNDGLALTIGDLIYLLRVITGDAQPFPKLSPFADDAMLEVTRENGELMLRSSSTTDIGGVYLEIEVPEGESCNLTAAPEAAGMRLEYERNDDVLHVLLYSDTRGVSVPAGANRLIAIGGLDDLEILHAEAADYNGNLIDVELEKTVVPDGFELAQNYPNPFNPKTDISMRFPHPTEWTLTIYNINGQVVRAYDGSAPAGVNTVTWDATDEMGLPVATGIYLYRLDAGDFSATKKMLLLK
jgi:hypothetical protein